MKTLVLNHGTSSCCGVPAKECKCGGRKQTNSKTPTPLPVLNWDNAFADDSGITPVHGNGSGPASGLGMPAWDFSEESKDSVEPTQPVTNRQVGKATHVPLGIPAWNF